MWIQITSCSCAPVDSSLWREHDAHIKKTIVSRGWLLRFQSRRKPIIPKATLETWRVWCLNQGINSPNLIMKVGIDITSCGGFSGSLIHFRLKVWNFCSWAGAFCILAYDLSFAKLMWNTCPTDWPTKGGFSEPKKTLSGTMAIVAGQGPEDMKLTVQTLVHPIFFPSIPSRWVGEFAWNRHVDGGQKNSPKIRFSIHHSPLFLPFTVSFLS